MPEKSEAIVGKNCSSPMKLADPSREDRLMCLRSADELFILETLQPGWPWSKHVKPVIGAIAASNSA